MEKSEDFRGLPLWNAARRLTVAALQFTSRRTGKEDAPGAAAEIQDTCVNILSALQRLQEPGLGRKTARAAARAGIRKLGHLLVQAHRLGLIGTFELALLVREVSAVRDSLDTPGSSEICCVVAAARQGFPSGLEFQ